MRILIAFDKFKNSLTAEEACAIAARVLARRHPDATLDVCPLTDGGEGFALSLTHAAGGTWESLKVTGARGGLADAGFGRVPLDAVPEAVHAFLPFDWSAGDWIAVMEMAMASGIAPLPEALRDPWQAETTGTGEVMIAAIRAGARSILLGVGGSATNDLGLGALRVLGVEAIDAAGALVVPPVPARWNRVAGFRGSATGQGVPFLVACDVVNPLLGPVGCSAVYGPQKGLQSGSLPAMEAAVERMAGLLCDHFGKSRDLARMPGAGAAGGIAFGLMCAANARLISGAGLVAAWLDLDHRLALADIVITGEGRFDGSSLQGKGPGEVVARAVSQGKVVHVFCGSVAKGLEVPPRVGLHPISPEDLPLAEALARGGELLAETMGEIPLIP